MGKISPPLPPDLSFAVPPSSLLTCDGGVIQNNPVGDEHGSAERLHRGRFCRLGTSTHVLDIRKIREEVANCVRWALPEICPGYGGGRINTLMYILTVNPAFDNAIYIYIYLPP